MRRVLVIGSGGAGKSTLSAALAARTGLPLVHLDTIYWRAGWVEPTKEEWLETVRRLISGARWILDGNYGGTLAERIAACDTVIFLDLPRWVCIRNVVLRRLRYGRRGRADLAPGCPDQLTWQFLAWIWGYPKRRRGEILRRLGALRPDQRAVILRSRREIAAFLETVAPLRTAA